MRLRALLTVACVAMVPSSPAPAQPWNAQRVKPNLAAMPWLDPRRSPDERAALALEQMTLDEKIQLVHGDRTSESPANSGGAAYVPGIPRLGLPALNMANSSVGVAEGAQRSLYATLMPACISEASAWSPTLSYDSGALIGRELRALGFNVSLGGGADLMREPRDGRTYEYRGEDPLLTGTLTAQVIRGTQDQRVIADIKHYAFNNQETGRMIGNVLIGYQAARESDLLAFQIALEEGHPGMVMCSYNKVWGDWACENHELLDHTLKGEWGFKGWVLSDWGATHSTIKAMDAGLDQEQPQGRYFGDALKTAIENGSVPVARLDDAVRRILRTMFAEGVVDHPPHRQAVDIYAGFALAQRVADAGSVLLKNDGALPLPKKAGETIAVIGSHADVGVLTGGGSAQVDPPGGNAVKNHGSMEEIGADGFSGWPTVWYPSSPLKALRAAAPGVNFIWADGEDPARAAAVAAKADAAIVFANQPMSEARDAVSLSLPHGQDKLIEAVAGANPHTIVVLETGGPVTMPWLEKVSAVAEVWYPGARGGEAIAQLLLGDVNFRGKLPITFPRREADLPHPIEPGTNLTPVPVPMTAYHPFLPNGQRRTSVPPFDIDYRTEGALVGYKWFDAHRITPLFPFGYGLSYTTFRYSGLEAQQSEATFTVTNSGNRAGVETAEVYVALPAPVRRAPRQLAGWTQVSLAPGESRTVKVKMEPLAMSVFDAKARRWQEPSGRYRVFVGGSSSDTPLTGTFRVK